jgi:uncharacterized protein (TIGR02301 family)
MAGRRRTIGALALAALAASGVAGLAQENAQVNAQENAQPTAPPPAAPPVAPPPYAPELHRLLEDMGALSYLVELCDGSAAGETWRRNADALIGAEAASDALRAVMIGYFNRGFLSHRAVYRACTPNAQLLVTDLLTEVARLSERLETRYGR